MATMLLTMLSGDSRQQGKVAALQIEIRSLLPESANRTRISGQNLK